ncbi:MULTISPECIES: hypothetical protein [Halocynthiibacter]|uniref:Uncharacterized protein n=1 Tax=Halocynthiibacter halioticoli TaxID=2986804 RepID=A0AAE3LRS8_9RHOB|nr:MULTISPECIES: hypothetical protein [Halocynthiibacter]MCV6824774.1 hypothetical protein [Halocynthiibacter halioticoli]MCW4057775.1 hypothetical protein [Halocynthiibacter sp. SDUM655004]MDE0589185.1 hypothetical protein [Halocynthiibacter sp. C4]
MDQFRAFFQLRSILLEMEQDLGLDKLAQSEIDIFLAARSLTENEGDVVASDQIRNHSLTKSIAQATYHRSLRSLLEKGMIKKAAGSKSKSYVVNMNPEIVLKNA